jgi:holo-[acyl-carrier protein] synthase
MRENMIDIGLDTVEISRIEKAMKSKNFLKFIFGEEEYNFFCKRGFPLQSVAANFCCKEAFSKSISTGFRNFGLKDVQILRDELGKPFFIFSGNALKIVEENKYKFSLSITHTKNYATAVVICFNTSFK